MTDLPKPGADPAANAPTPDGETPAGDPELAALVQRAQHQRLGPPRLSDHRRSAAPGQPDDTASADTLPISEPGIDPVPVVPLAAAVTGAERPARPHRRRRLALRFGVSFVVGFLLAVGIGAGALYAWGQQYEGRVLPGVSVGSTNLGGLTREQAEAAVASAYGSLGNGQITLTGPDGQTTSISYADVGRGPDTSRVVDAALASGRQSVPLLNLIGAPQAAFHGATLGSAVTYDRDKLAAAVETLATASTRRPSTPPRGPCRTGRSRSPPRRTVAPWTRRPC